MKRVGLFSYGIALSVFFCSSNYIIVSGQETVQFPTVETVTKVCSTHHTFELN